MYGKFCSIIINVDLALDLDYHEVLLKNDKL